MVTRGATEAIASSTVRSDAPTDIIPPPPAIPAMARLRRATTRAPSRTDSAPATVAAAISPCEWPMTTSGSTPWSRHSPASETMTAHSAGCTTSTRSKSGAPGAPRSTSCRE